MRTKPHCLVLAAAFVAATSLGSVGGSGIGIPNTSGTRNLGSTNNGSGNGGSSNLGTEGSSLGQ